MIRNIDARFRVDISDHFMWHGLYYTDLFNLKGRSTSQLEKDPDFMDKVNRATEFVRHSEDGDSCGTCQELDATSYADINDIPDIPHPNCKCVVEEVVVSEESEEEEPSQKKQKQQDFKTVKRRLR